MTTREAIEARLLTLLPETQAIMVNVSQLRDICASHATVEAERDEAVNAIAEANASDIGQLLATHQDSIVRAVNRADAAEARAEALARAVREWQEAHKAWLDAYARLDRNQSPEQRREYEHATSARHAAIDALLALDVQESSRKQCACGNDDYDSRKWDACYNCRQPKESS